MLYLLFLLHVHEYTAKRQWQKTSTQMLESKKPFGIDITPLQKSPDDDEKKIIEIAMKFAFQIDSIILNLFTGKFFFFIILFRQ